MSGKYLLDTSVAVRVLNREIDLGSRRASPAEVFLSVTVAGELLFGAAKSSQPELNRTRVLRLVADCPLVSEDLQTAQRYGALKAALLSKGRPIPENDLWIAASALRHGLVLVTRDRHFAEVEGLEVDPWA